MTKREQLAAWILGGLEIKAQVKDEDFAGYDPYVYRLISEFPLGLAWIGKVGNAVEASKLLGLEVWDGTPLYLYKVRSLSVARLSELLDIPLDVALGIEEVYRAYRCSPQNIAKLLEEDSYAAPRWK